MTSPPPRVFDTLPGVDIQSLHEAQYRDWLDDPVLLFHRKLYEVLPDVSDKDLTLIRFTEWFSRRFAGKKNELILARLLRQVAELDDKYIDVVNWYAAGWNAQANSPPYWFGRDTSALFRWLAEIYTGIGTVLVEKARVCRVLKACYEMRNKVGDNGKGYEPGDNEKGHGVGDNEKGYGVGDNEKGHGAGDNRKGHRTGDNGKGHEAGHNERSWSRRERWILRERAVERLQCRFRGDV